MAHEISEAHASTTVPTEESLTLLDALLDSPKKELEGRQAKLSGEGQSSPTKRTLLSMRELNQRLTAAANNWSPSSHKEVPKPFIKEQVSAMLGLPYDEFQARLQKWLGKMSQQQRVETEMAIRQALKQQNIVDLQHTMMDTFADQCAEPSDFHYRVGRILGEFEETLNNRQPFRADIREQRRFEVQLLRDALRPIPYQDRHGKMRQLYIDDFVLRAIRAVLKLAKQPVGSKYNALFPALLAEVREANLGKITIHCNTVFDDRGLTNVVMRAMEARVVTAVRQERRMRQMVYVQATEIAQYSNEQKIVEQRQKLDELAQERMSLLQELTELREELNITSGLAELATTCTSSEVEDEELREQLIAASERINLLESENQQLRDELAEANETIEALRQKNQQLCAQLAVANQNAQKFEALARANQELRSQLIAARGEISILHSEERQWHSTQARFVTLSLELDSARQELKKVSSELTVKNSEVGELTDMYEQTRDANTELMAYHQLRVGQLEYQVNMLAHYIVQNDPKLAEESPFAESADCTDVPADPSSRSRSYHIPFPLHEDSVEVLATQGFLSAPERPQTAVSQPQGLPKPHFSGLRSREPRDYTTLGPGEFSPPRKKVPDQLQPEPAYISGGEDDRITTVAPDSPTGVSTP